MSSDTKGIVNSCLVAFFACKYVQEEREGIRKRQKGWKEGKKEERQDGRKEGEWKGKEGRKESSKKGGREGRQRRVSDNFIFLSEC